jgi:diguanylate cyclase (GGDEF)-like protein/PAS domain S-box-containing protein
MVIQSTFYKDLLDNLYDGIYFVDRDRIITYWNKGAERITGYPSEQVVGQSCRDNLLNHVTVDGKQLCQGNCPLVESMETGTNICADVFLHHANGHRVPVQVRISPLRDDQGSIIGAVETFSSEAHDPTIRKQLRELRQTAQTDSLTGIGNRSFIEGRLHAAITELEFHPNSIIGIAFIDIDQFKDINDSYGHENGDKILQMTAATLAQNMRTSDVIGRWGGDEFLAILYDVTSIEAFKFILEKMRVLVECSRLDLDEANIQVTISLGASLLRKSDSAESVFRRVDSLMYQSKQAGRNQMILG